MSNLKLGSLFSGIGGFELVGSWYDIEPVWASEIEAAPIRITKEHFPNMKHLGDITKIHGDEIEPVDILTGGSPCQDLSVAGKQSGIKMQCEECGTLVDFKETENSKLCPNCGAELTFTRSGLFMEQMRIIREMREKTNECYPKIVIWENVSGALSSNNGDDFFCVLQEFCKLMAERIPTFRPENWSNAGEILGKSGSIAWRLFDAQYWGVPQRRRRIFLVADFTGQHAGEILFKSESLRRHLTPSTVPWKILTSKAEESIGNSSRNQSRTESITESYGFDGYNSDITGDISATLGTNCGASSGRNGIVEESESVICVATQQANAEIMIDKYPTLTAANGTSGSNKPYVVVEETEKPLAFEPGAASRLGGHTWEDIAGTLTSQMGDNQMSVVTDDSSATVYGMCSVSSNSMKSDNPDSGIYETDVSKTLDTNGLNPSCNQGGNLVVEGPVYCLQGNCIDRGNNAGCNGKGWKEDSSFTLTTADRHAVAYEESESVLCVDQGGGKSACGVSEEVSPTLTCTHGGAPAVLCPDKKVYGVGEGSGGNVRLLDEKTYCLTTGGGKPGQGFGCVLIEESDETNEKPYVAAFAHQQGGKMPSLPYSEEVSPTLLSSQTMAVVIENHGQDCRWQEAKNNVCPTLAANMGMGGNNTPLVLENPPEIAEDSKESAVPYAESGFATYGEGDVGTLRASGGHYGGGSETLILSDKPITLKPDNCMGTAEDKAIMLMARDYKDPQIVLDAPTTMTRGSFTSISVDKAYTLMAEEYRCQQIVIKPKSVVRRLTPLECERLQGFPDSWTASESDAARYKALGNSVALPCVNYVMSGIADVLDAE